MASPERLVARAAELGQPGIAITDHGNLFGSVAFAQACQQHSVKPAHAIELYESIPHAFDIERDGAVLRQKWQEATPRYHHLTVWAATRQGWDNLCALHSQSYTADYRVANRPPLVDRASLERHHEGLLIGLGCIQSRVSWALRTEHDAAYAAARWYVEVFGPQRVFMELMANLPEQQALLHEQRKLARRLGIQCVATNDVHYITPQEGVENGSHHLMVRGRFFKRQNTEESGDKASAGFGHWYGAGFWLKSAAEMLATGGLQPAELEQSCIILDKIDFSFAQLPAPRTPEVGIPQPGEDAGYDAFLETVGADT